MTSSGLCYNPLSCRGVAGLRKAYSACCKAALLWPELPHLAGLLVVLWDGGGSRAEGRDKRAQDVDEMASTDPS